MKTLRFYGYSDDNFAVEGDGLTDEISCYDSAATWAVTCGNEGLIVFGMYAPGSRAPTWVVGIAPLDEDEPLPDWPMRWLFSGYSAVLEIDAPSAVSVVSDMSADE